MNSDFPIVATLMQLQTALVGLPQPLIDQMHAAGPFKVLIATLLSLRTRDDTTAVAATTKAAAIRTIAANAPTTSNPPSPDRGFVKSRAEDHFSPGAGPKRSDLDPSFGNRKMRTIEQRQRMPPATGSGVCAMGSPKPAVA